MSTPAEVKVVVNTAEAQAALQRLEAEARRIEAEAAAGKKPGRNGNYKKAKGISDQGQAEHANAPIASGGVGLGTAAAAGAVASRVTAALDRTDLNSKGSVRAYLEVDRGVGAFNKSTYFTSYASMLQATNRGWGINPNLAASVARARTKFRGMDGFNAEDQERIHAAALRSAKSVKNNLYGWWAGRSSRAQARLDAFIEQQIGRDYDSQVAAIKDQEKRVEKRANFQKKLNKWTHGWIKKAGSSIMAGASLAYGAGGLRGFLGKLIGGVAIGMTIKQIGAGSADRLTVLEKKGLAGYAWKLGENVVSPALRFGAGVIQGGANAVFEGIGLVTNFFGSGGPRQARKWADQNNRNFAWLIDGEPDSDLDRQKTNTINDISKFLYENGRWGTPEDNRQAASALVDEAMRQEKKKQEVFGWYRPLRTRGR